MLDQYENKVPEDLVVLDVDPNSLTREERERILNAPWYETDWSNTILVPANDVAGLTETNPLDAGIDLAAEASLQYIDTRLKRVDPIDGFYHA